MTFMFIVIKLSLSQLVHQELNSASRVMLDRLSDPWTAWDGADILSAWLVGICSFYNTQMMNMYSSNIYALCNGRNDTTFSNA